MYDGKWKRESIDAMHFHPCRAVYVVPEDDRIEGRFVGKAVVESFEPGRRSDSHRTRRVEHTGLYLVHISLIGDIPVEREVFFFGLVLER